MSKENVTAAVCVHESEGSLNESDNCKHYDFIIELTESQRMSINKNKRIFLAYFVGEKPKWVK
jgi:hypothetical protein